MQMMLVLTIFEYFFRIESMGLHWPLYREHRLQHEPLLHLNALVFEIVVEEANAFNLYIRVV